MLENISRGDTAVFANGEEAKIDAWTVSAIGNYHICFDRRVTGWIYCRNKNWIYNSNGEFVRDPKDSPANNIVKVLHGFN